MDIIVYVKLAEMQKLEKNKYSFWSFDCNYCLYFY